MLIRALIETCRELNHLYRAVLFSAVPVRIPRRISIVPGRFPRVRRICVFCAYPFGLPNSQLDIGIAAPSGGAPLSSMPRCLSSKVPMSVLKAQPEQSLRRRDP